MTSISSQSSKARQTGAPTIVNGSKTSFPSLPLRLPGSHLAIHMGRRQLTSASSCGSTRAAWMTGLGGVITVLASIPFWYLHGSKMLTIPWEAWLSVAYAGCIQTGLEAAQSAWE